MDNNISIKANIDRFSGFADCYDKYRPAAPAIVTDILLNYLGKKPSLVIDLGSGTGLSTFLWSDYSEKVIGIEPNADMRNMASAKLLEIHKPRNISFQEGYCHSMNVKSSSVDIVACSQSFHWMEPNSTLEEVDRVLSKGGIFAAYDCDWPPTVDWLVEEAYTRLLNTSEFILSAQPEASHKARKWDKENHLKSLKESGKFRFIKEVCFHNKEKADAERYLGIALSQGGLQTALKRAPEKIIEHINNFRKVINESFKGSQKEIIFSYKMRLGIK